MKKIIILLLLLLSNKTLAYNESIDYKGYSLVHYEYNNKSYYIKVPDDINYLDNLYMQGVCTRYCNLIKLNHLLVKKGLTPIF